MCIHYLNLMVFFKDVKIKVYFEESGYYFPIQNQDAISDCVILNRHKNQQFPFIITFKHQPVILYRSET